MRDWPSVAIFCAAGMLSIAAFVYILRGSAAAAAPNRDAPAVVSQRRNVVELIVVSALP